MTVITYDRVRTCEGISRRLVKQGMKLILLFVKRTFLNFQSRIMRVAERKTADGGFAEKRTYGGSNTGFPIRSSEPR